MNAWRRGVISGLLLSALGLGGCGEPPPPEIQTSIPSVPPVAVQPATAQTLRLDFAEIVPGAELTPLRHLVTARHLRIDSGDEGDGGFILYDRNEQVIYSVSQASQTIIVIPYAEGGKAPPSPFALEERQVKDKILSSVAGSSQPHLDFLAEGELCYSAVVVSGLLPEAQAAEREYLDTLGSEQRLHVDKLPAGMRDPCDLTRNAYVPARHLESGYPVQLWDPSGYRRSLLAFDAAWAADLALFALPEGYERLEIGTLR